MSNHTLISTWRQMLFPDPVMVSPPQRGHAAISKYDPSDDLAGWTRCRDRAQFHLGRARRAKDRGRYREAAEEIERALRYDDTNEAYYQVLAQCHFYSQPRDVEAGRAALERALELNPRSSYTARLLLRLDRGITEAITAKDTLRNASTPARVDSQVRWSNRMSNRVAAGA